MTKGLRNGWNVTLPMQICLVNSNGSDEVVSCVIYIIYDIHLILMIFQKKISSKSDIINPQKKTVLKIIFNFSKYSSNFTFFTLPMMSTLFNDIPEFFFFQIFFLKKQP